MEAHAEEMFEVLSDPAIYEFENSPPESLEKLRERFQFLERRESPDGTEKWLNWVVRLPSGESAGYVQATVEADGTVHIAYEFASRYWGRGIASSAVQQMMRLLRAEHETTLFLATFKAANFRSRKLLERNGFSPGHDSAEIEPDEERWKRLK